MAKNLFAIFCSFLCSLLIIGLYTSALAQEDQDARYYYIGNIGEMSIQMDLNISDNSIDGSYYNNKTGIPIPLSGEVDFESHKINLITKSGNRNFEGSFTPMNKILGTKIEGNYIEQDGLVKIPFELTKVANYDTSLIRQLDKVETEWTYPILISRNEAIQKTSSMLKERMKPDIEEFQKMAKEAFMEDLITNGYEFHYGYAIEYYSEELISFTGQVYSYTGGAHGNTYYASSNYWIKNQEAKLLKLSDLFKKDSDYIKILSDLLIAELSVQKAGWVVNGDIKSFKEDEIGLFALSPRGVQFAFAPYAVGPYVEGAFFVTIPFNNIARIIDQKGPLSNFLDDGQAEVKKEK